MTLASGSTSPKKKKEKKRNSLTLDIQHQVGIPSRNDDFPLLFLF